MTTSNKEMEQIEQLIAQAINGPYYEPPEHSGYTLQQLRDHKWRNQTTDEERHMCLSKARAVVRLLKGVDISVDALKHALP
jgi:hypothetical protein